MDIDNLSYDAQLYKTRRINAANAVAQRINEIVYCKAMVRRRQIELVSEAAKRYLGGLPFVTPRDINSNRFRAMIKAFIKGNHK